MKRALSSKTIKLLLFAVVLATVAQCAATQVAPFEFFTNTLSLPTNYTSLSRSAYPSAPGSSSPGTSPSPAVSFQALGDDNTMIPPDTDGAVGTNHVMTMLNSQVRIQDRSGTVISTTSLTNWWSGMYSLTVTDPHVLYDPYSGRWIAVAVADPQLSTSAILIAVSATNNPTNTWYKWSVKADSGSTMWADFPTVGFNKDRIIVQANMFNNSNNAFNRSQIWAFDKLNMYNGTLNTPKLMTLIGYGITQRPAVVYDNTVATNYLVQSYNSSSGGKGYLSVYTVSGAVGSEVLTQLGNFPNTTSWANLPGVQAPQTNSTITMDPDDDRMLGVIYRNGYLWCAHTIFLPTGTPTRASVQWWQLDTSGVAVQVGRIDDASSINFYAYPSISANKFNDVLIGYSHFSTNQYASADYSFHAFFDAPNTMETGVTFKSGEGLYYKTFTTGDNRWGDYSCTWVDPNNDVNFWTIQEYAGTPVGTPTTDGAGRWGTWWANVAMTLPANDMFTNSTTLSGAQGTVNANNYRATKETGEPNHAGNAGGSSVWYSWTAPTNGIVIFDTSGSSLTTLLAAYTGSSVSSLSVVASNTASPSKISFTATSGTTYRVAVDGVSGSQLPFTLNWIQPVAPTFIFVPASANVLIGGNVTLTSSAAGLPTPAYQWQLNGTNVSGATATNYSISGALMTNAGNYTVVVTNVAGSLTSSPPALLNVFSTAAATFSTPVFTTNSQFQFTLTGITGSNYIVQAATTNFTNWISLSTNASPIIFTDTNASNYSYRFYRAIYAP